MELELNDCQLINLARVIYIADTSVTAYPFDSAFIEQYLGIAINTAAEAGLPVEDMVEQYLGANS